MGCLLQPEQAESLVLLPFVMDEASDVRQVRSSTFSTVPARRGGGWGTHPLQGRDFPTLHASQAPWGKMGNQVLLGVSIQGSGWPRACISDWLLGEADPTLRTA